MTNARDFEALLRSWLDESATSTHLDKALASVLSETAHSRPRPAWLVGLVAEPMADVRGGGLSRAVMLVAVGAAVVLAAAIGLGLIDLPRRNDIGNKTPAPVPTRQPTPSPTPAGQPMSFGQLPGYQVRLVSDTVGWIFDGTSLLRTSDSGQTWIEINLPHPTTPSSAATISMVDVDTLFAAFPGSPWTLAVTHDAGQTWTETTLDEPAGAYVVLAIRSSIDGAATFFPNSDLPGIQVYQTADGGATWSGPTARTLPVVPDVGACKFSYPPGDLGVISCETGKLDAKPFADQLWLSIDGAETWIEGTFPTDSVAPAGAGKGLSGTPWVDGDRILIAVAVWDSGSTGIYESTDDAKTWSLLSQVPGWQGILNFLSPTDWVGCSTGIDGNCVSSQDGGATWRQYGSDDATRMGGTTTWASVDHGWGLVDCSRMSYSVAPPYCGGTVKSALLETFDGGQTWRPIG